MKISVIIPTLNEGERITSLVRGLSRQDAGCEIIVVDGGSTDGTAGKARAAGARVRCTDAGRGQQLSVGVTLATGEVYLFLHADTRFPESGLAAIRKSLSDPAVIGGNFRILFDGDDGFSRWLNGFYAWIRSKGLYYGDSAVFLRGSAYQDLGGVLPIALMEDYDLVRRMERRGDTVCIFDAPVVSSSRRFKNRNAFAIIAQWLYLHALYYVGFSPKWLGRLYDSERRREAPTSSHFPLRRS